MSPISITVEEYFNEIRRMEGARPEGATIREIMDQTGMSERRVRETLGAAKRAGRLIVNRRLDESLAGSIVRVPVYRIAEAQAPKKK